MINFLDIVTTISVALLIGCELAVWVFINPILWKLDDAAQASSIKLFAARLGTAMPFWYVVSLLLLVAEAVVRRHQAGVILLIASIAIWVAVVIFTILFLVPINNRLARMDSGPMPAGARLEHKRWDGMHRLRVLALGASLICLLTAIHL